VSGRVLPSGEHAVLVELDSLDEVLALHDRLWVRSRMPGLIDAVVGARTLLLVAASAGDLAGVRASVSRLLAAKGRLTLSPGSAASPFDDGVRTEVVEVPARYDGPDLDEVGRLTGLTPDEVVRAHTGRPWRVGFAGFAPGFAYLVDGDPRLEVPRRATPRPRVPAGAVGLAGEFSGIYPRPSPGGWQLIGQTDLALWDLDREPPALLRPGLRVQFVDAGGDR
jgi:KipI family sensor histidine kinase inhibitor